MKKRVANVITQLLINEQVEYVFGVTGKTIAPLLDAFLDFDQIHFIASKHENGAALMAYGYAQGSGKIGVCCGSTGGGSTNLATGVATAYMNSVPLLVITGQVSTQDYGKGAFQESTGFGQSIDTVDFFRSITKESFAAINPNKVAEAIEYGIRSAKSGRMGPVHVNIPFDIQQAYIESHEPHLKPRIFTEGTVGESAGLEEALLLIDRAQRPVFLVGWGAVQCGAHHEIRKISERLGIPVATTIQGKGAIPSNHPLCLGVVGICGHQVAADYVFDHSDLLIAVGTSFGEFSTYGWDSRFFNKKKIIQIDIDNREIGKNFPVEIGLTGDAKVIINQLNLMIRNKEVKAKPSGRKIGPFIESRGRVLNPRKLEDDSVPLKPQRLLNEVNKLAPDNTMFLADSSSHWAWSMHYLEIKEKGNFFPTLGLGAMGASIGSAIGLKLSLPDNPVVCICGDGSFLMGGNEIATAGQYNIPLIWIVFNDSRYGMPEASIKKMYNRTIGVSLSHTNFAKMAESVNVKGYRVETPEEFSLAFKEALDSNQPVVLDVLIDKTEVPPIGKRKLTTDD